MARTPKAATAADERKEFTVRGTTISDEDGKRCPAGSTIMLGAALAQKFHDLGFLDIPLDAMYKDDQDAHIAALTAELDTVKANLQAALTKLDEADSIIDGLKTAVDSAAEVVGANAGDSVQGASGDNVVSGGGKPPSGDVATGTDAPKNNRRKRAGQL